MVSRPPVSNLNTSNAGASQRTNIPPYPISPEGSSEIASTTAASTLAEDAHNSGFDLIDMNEVRRERRNSDVSSHGTWDTDDDDEEEEEEEDNKKPQDVDIPKPLRITPSKQNLVEEPSQTQPREDIPAILKPGPPSSTTHASSLDHYASQALANPWADDTKLTPQTTGRSQNSNNPYLKLSYMGNAAAQTAQKPASSPLVVPWPSTQQSQAVPWPATESQSSSVAAPPPPPTPPPALPPPPPFTAAPVELPAVSTPTQELAQLSFDTQPSSSPSANTTKPTQIVRKPIAPPRTTPPSPPTDALSNPWQQSGAQQELAGIENDENDLYSAPSGPPPRVAEASDTSSYSAPPGPPPGAPQNLVNAPVTTTSTHTAPSSRSNVRPANTLARQRSEHYQIKHINWQDGSNMRQSPILTQNANGPCPLLALVNALLLSTPANADTALVETLRTREQISLGLLLDAVFDELVSGRRGDTATSLPDVSELYAFLLALHTGMNVNPRFVSTGAEMAGFEQTREMRFYSTFNIALIHGWLPRRGSPIYQAFERRAQSFEDAQNIQFAEPELEEKLNTQGLSPEEDLILQDIRVIKQFLDNWPTQLTDYGLESISSTLRAGQVAILFRNDHFSTIYKVPSHGALMTLVTDSGYGSHDEIVWESLVDVNGAASEMFSGDFRVVSHDQDVRLNHGNSAGGSEGWETVPNRSRHRDQAQGRVDTGRPQTHDTTTPPPPLPGPRPSAGQVTSTSPANADTEQEDRDFALALQLQEEEDAQQRQREERRRNEQRLSEQFLSGQNEGRPPAIPPRRGGSRMTTGLRPAVNRPADTESSSDAPPTYEQSASDRPYQENGAQSSTLDMYDALRRQEQQSAYASQNSSSPTLVGPGRRTSQGNRLVRRSSQLHPMPGSYDSGRRPGQAATVQDAEERCVMM